MLLSMPLSTEIPWTYESLSWFSFHEYRVMALLLLKVVLGPWYLIRHDHFHQYFLKVSATKLLKHFFWAEFLGFFSSPCLCKSTCYCRCIAHVVSALISMDTLEPYWVIFWGILNVIPWRIMQQARWCLNRNDVDIVTNCLLFLFTQGRDNGIAK